MKPREKGRKLSPEPPKDISKRSGHNLHVDIAQRLANAGYEVEISPYYVDVHSDKPREVDIVARKTFTISDHRREYLQLVFAIDCKYFLQHTVFWTFKNEKPRNALKLIQMEAEEVGRHREHSFAYFRTDSIARLFHSGSRQEGDPISDPIYKASSQAISGSIFAREHTRVPGIVYPIVVADGPGKFFLADELPSEQKSILLHMDYSYYPDRDLSKKSVREPFYVLLTRQSDFDRMIEILEGEAAEIKEIRMAAVEKEIFEERRWQSQSRKDYENPGL